MDYIFNLNFYNYLHYNDYINLLKVTNYYYTYYYKLLNKECFYQQLLSVRFSNKFTTIVKPIIISYQDCFYRVKRFEYILKEMGYNLWEEDIYYLFWNIKYKLDCRLI